MARPTTTAMITRSTTLLLQAGFHWSVTAAGSRDGERYPGGRPGPLLEVDRHHRGLVTAWPQPGDGGAVGICGGHRGTAWLARRSQVDAIVDAKASIGPAQRDL